MVNEDKNGFLAVEAEFLDGELITDFTYFEKEKELYKKYQWRIRQFYHDIKTIEHLLDMKLIDTKEIKLFSEDEADKVIMIFKMIK